MKIIYKGEKAKNVKKFHKICLQTSTSLMHSKDADTKANGVDPDQTALSGSLIYVYPAFLCKYL